MNIYIYIIKYLVYDCFAVCRVKDCSGVFCITTEQHML